MSSVTDGEIKKMQNKQAENALMDFFVDFQQQKKANKHSLFKLQNSFMHLKFPLAVMWTTNLINCN